MQTKNALNKKARLRLVVLLMASILCLVALLIAKSPTPFGIAQAQEPQMAQKVKTQSLILLNQYTYTRSFIGKVEASQSSRIGFELTGTVHRLLVDEGANVKKGQPLATLDTKRLDAKKREFQASLARARATAALAKSTFDRVKQIRAQNAVSEQELDEAQEHLTLANANFELAKAQLFSVDVDLAKTQLKAPFTGIITERLQDQGTVLNPGQSLFVIQELHDTFARFGITPDFANTLTKGQLVKLSKKSPTSANFSLKGKVKSLIPVQGATRTVDLLVQIQKPKPVNLAFGESLHLKAQSTQQQQGAWLPLSALTEGRRGLWAAYFYDPLTQTAQRKSLELHHIENGKGFVSGALTESKVIVEGAFKLVPGQKIALDD